MKKLTRKLSSLVALTLVLCMVMSVPVFASESNNYFLDSETNNKKGIMSKHTLDSGSEVCNSGYYCSITLHLDNTYYRPYFRAGAAGNSNNLVNCTVTTPTGITYDLGSIIANGSVTSYFYLSGYGYAGDYIFEFDGTNGGPTGFAAFIYADY